MFPELQTTRFLLKQFQSSDTGFVFEGLSHPDVIRYYGVHYNSLEDTKVQMTWYNNLLKEQTGIWWKIVSKQTNERLGAIGINNHNRQHKKAEIGYWLLPQYWKQGIISEVMPIVTNYLFEHQNIHRIEALVEDGNENSCQVLQKAGFVYEGKLRDYEIKNGNHLNFNIFSLLSTDLQITL